MILDAWKLSREQTWADYLVWLGVEVGRMSEQEIRDWILIDDGAGDPGPEVRRIGTAELARRAALEAS